MSDAPETGARPLAAPDNVTPFPVIPRPTALHRPDTVIPEQGGMRTAFASPEALAELLADRVLAAQAARRAAAPPPPAEAVRPGTAVGRAGFTRAPRLARLHWIIAGALNAPTAALLLALMLAPAAAALVVRLAGAVS